VWAFVALIGLYCAEWQGLGLFFFFLGAGSGATDHVRGDEGGEVKRRCAVQRQIILDHTVCPIEFSFSSLGCYVLLTPGEASRGPRLVSTSLGTLNKDETYRHLMPRKILTGIPTPIHRRRMIIGLLVNAIKLEGLEPVHKAFGLLLDLGIGDNAIEMNHCDCDELFPNISAQIQV
jgi:hypothetical protein